MKFIEINSSIVNAEHIIELFLEKNHGKERTLIRFRGNDKFVEIGNYSYKDLKKILLDIDKSGSDCHDHEHRYL